MASLSDFYPTRLEDRNERPEDEIISGEVEGLVRCKCGRHPVVKTVAAFFDNDPRCYGWEYDTYVICACGKSYNWGGGPQHRRELWNKRYAAE